MTSLYESLEVDRGAKEDGVWVAVLDGVEIKVASTDSKRYRDVSRRLMKPYFKILQAGGRIPDDKQVEIAVVIAADSLLLDWKGVTDRDGNELPFSRENVIKVLTDLEVLRNMVAEIAGEAETFNKAALELAVKNSAKPSVGKSSGAAKKNDA